MDEFDTNKILTDHECYSQKNSNIIGKFKDELNGLPAQDFGTLCS